MKNRLALFAIFVLVQFLLITPVFAELTTDKVNYSIGETVIVMGVAPLGVEEYTFELIDPDGEIMAIGQFELWEEREYRFDIPVGGQLFTDSGIFTVNITYDNGEKDQTTFGFETSEQLTPKTTQSSTLDEPSSLQIENAKLKEQIRNLQMEIDKLQKQIDDLTAIIMEQVRVMLDTLGIKY